MPQLYLTPRSVYELFQDRPLDMKMRERRGLLYGVYFQIGHAHMWTHTDPRKRATSIDLYQFGAAGAQTLGFHSAPEQWEWQRQGQWMLWCHQCPFICFSGHPAWFGLLKLKHIITVLVDACFIHLVILSGSYFAFTYRILSKVSCTWELKVLSFISAFIGKYNDRSISLVLNSFCSLMHTAKASVIFRDENSKESCNKWHDPHRALISASLNQCEITIRNIR